MLSGTSIWTTVFDLLGIDIYPDGEFDSPVK